MNVVIIGNGISGITAARWIRKLSDHKITVISSESDHFYSRTALMYIYMGHMRYEDTKPYEDWFWDKNKIDLLNGHVDQIDFNNKNCHLKVGAKIPYDKLVLAVGSIWNKFGWPGQELDGVGGLYSLQDLEYLESKSSGIKKAVIVGGGLIGIEMAEMFHARNIDVSFLVREKSYWEMVLPPEESQMINDHIIENHIDLKLGVNLDQIIDDGNGKVSGIVVKETQEKIYCQFVGLTAGVRPNISFLKESILETDRGILVNEYLQTSQKDVYAIGDCAQQRNPLPGRRPVEAIWYTGRMMGETVAYNICNKQVSYDPGIWFNSAKFFDIEYQVYGEMPAKLPEHHNTLFWKHSDNKKSIRINYHKGTGEILGFNLMGIRYRHEVCEKWIKNKTHIEEVLKNLGLANFDPEFFDSFERDIIKVYENRHNKKIEKKQKRSLSSVLQFLKS